MGRISLFLLLFLLYTTWDYCVRVCVVLLCIMGWTKSLLLFTFILFWLIGGPSVFCDIPKLMLAMFIVMIIIMVMIESIHSCMASRITRTGKWLEWEAGHMALRTAFTYVWVWSQSSPTFYCPLFSCFYFPICVESTLFPCLLCTIYPLWNETMAPPPPTSVRPAASWIPLDPWPWMALYSVLFIHIKDRCRPVCTP